MSVRVSGTRCLRTGSGSTALEYVAAPPGALEALSELFCPACRVPLIGSLPNLCPKCRTHWTAYRDGPQARES